MNQSQVLVEVGRLHLQVLELKAENEELRAALAAQTKPASVDLSVAGAAPEDTDEEPTA